MFVMGTYEPVKIYVFQVISVDIRGVHSVKQTVASAARLACSLSSLSLLNVHIEVKDLIIVT